MIGYTNDSILEGGDYLELGTVLDPRYNDENRAIALAWWQRQGWRWKSSTKTRTENQHGHHT